MRHSIFLVFCFCFSVQLCLAERDYICPEFCYCDLYLEQNRADCSTNRLISANLELPRIVEILDLSYNDITQLDDAVLASYVYLTNLSLAHNALQSIYADAFIKLQRLQSLDLSYNRLQHIDEHLIESNKRLITLNLEGNKFMTLGMRMLLRSSSLRTLNLRNAQIGELGVEFLSALPALETLDLAGNLLITLDGRAFSAQRQLSLLNLEDNHFACDQPMRKTLTKLKKRGFEVLLTDCESGAEWSSVEQPTKFSRMEEQANDEALATSTAASVLSVWHQIPKNETTESSPCGADALKLCQLYQNCLARLTHKMLTTDQADAPTEARRRTYTLRQLESAFLAGSAVGIFLVVSVFLIAIVLRSYTDQKPTSQHSVLSTVDSMPADRNEPVVDLRHSAPPMVTQPVRAPRCSNRRRWQHADTQAVAVARRNYEPDGSFIERLLGRPARHGYYRTLNRNTATLIRHLSRSSLFSNRMAQNSVDHAPSYPDAARFYADEDYSAQPQPPDSPPPQYKDVVMVDILEDKNRTTQA